AVKGAKDHLRAAMTAGFQVQVEGLHWNPNQNEYEPFSTTVHPYPHPHALEAGILTTGVLASASFVIYPTGNSNSLPKGSPLASSGIEKGDRIAWVDGESIYSLGQLSALLNDRRALLTVKRKNTTFLCRVKRVPVAELKLTRNEKEELSDWQWEAD